jgi:hypothetical protein
VAAHRERVVLLTPQLQKTNVLLCIFAITKNIKFMLGESLVPTAWHILRLQIEETTSRNGGQL